MVWVEIDPDETNKQKVVRDIQTAVDKVKNLPKDVEDPLVTEITSKQYPIIEVSLSGNMTEHKLQDHADTLEDILEDIADIEESYELEINVVRINDLAGYLGFKD